MPRAVKPMFALYSRLPQQQELFGFEYKWDGVRAIYYWNGFTPLIQSRNMLDITVSYPEVEHLGKTLAKTPFIFDGEIIALDEHGRTSFNLLQHRMGIVDAAQARKRAQHIPVVYMIFDLLYIDKFSLMNLPYEKRRTILESIGIAGPAWQVPPYTKGNGYAMLEAAGEIMLEGVVAKRLDSIYEPGRRTGAWIKTKLVQGQEFVVGGWTALKGNDPSMIGSLLVGYYQDGKLIYAGSVGTGYTETDRRHLSQLLNKYQAPKSQFHGPAPRQDAFYIRPELVAEIEFRGWTEAGILRQPSFKGLRFDKDPAQVVREDVTESLVRPL
jgi:bifunctional non-homologous end joining protein LigD